MITINNVKVNSDESNFYMTVAQMAKLCKVSTQNVSQIMDRLFLVYPELINFKLNNSKQIKPKTGRTSTAYSAEISTRVIFAISTKAAKQLQTHIIDLVKRFRIEKALISEESTFADIISAMSRINPEMSAKVELTKLVYTAKSFFATAIDFVPNSRANVSYCTSLYTKVIQYATGCSSSKALVKNRKSHGMTIPDLHPTKQRESCAINYLTLNEFHIATALLQQLVGRTYFMKYRYTMQDFINTWHRIVGPVPESAGTAAELVGTR